MVVITLSTELQPATPRMRGAMPGFAISIVTGENGPMRRDTKQASNFFEGFFQGLHVRILLNDIRKAFQSPVHQCRVLRTLNTSAHGDRSRRDKDISAVHDRAKVSLDSL